MTSTLHITSPDQIRIAGTIAGLSGPDWQWTGSALFHPIGLTFNLSGPAAQRVNEAITAHRKAQADTPATTSRLPTTETNHEGYDLASKTWGDDPTDNEGSWSWVKTTPQPVTTCVIDDPEVLLAPKAPASFF